MCRNKIQNANVVESYRLFVRMAAMDFIDVRTAYISRIKSEKHRIESVREDMSKRGFEVVAAGPRDVTTHDGREILWVHGAAWALRPEMHAAYLSGAFESAKNTQTKSVVGTESLSQMTCPKCGDSLQHTSVCPKCAAGKLGYRHRYTCVCGGVDLISKDKL